MEYYIRIILCVFIIAHLSCEKEKISLYGVWENNNKDTYNFMNEEILIKRLNSDNNIKIEGSWMSKKEDFFFNDTLYVTINYKKISLNDSLVKKINTNKILIINILNKNEIRILNENNTRFIKISP